MTTNHEERRILYDGPPVHHGNDTAVETGALPAPLPDPYTFHTFEGDDYAIPYEHVDYVKAGNRTTVGPVLTVYLLSGQFVYLSPVAGAEFMAGWRRWRTAKVSPHFLPGDRSPAPMPYIWPGAKTTGEALDAAERFNKRGYTEPVEPARMI